jgi:predicted GIY-YIG superfamily endonuclease
MTRGPRNRAGDQLLLWPPVRPLGERFGHAFFRTLPERPGVYLLCGPRDGVLYVGKAKNLRQRLGSYRSASTEGLPRKLRRLLATVERIHWDECADGTAALARERELIVTLKPRFNTAGVYPAPPLRLGWTAAAKALDLGLTETADIFAEHSDAGRAWRMRYPALLRLLWGAAHPAAPLPAMPSRLLGERPLRRWQLPIADEVVPRLRRWVAGDSAEMVGWLLARRPPLNPFEQAWQLQDADRLREGFGPDPESAEETKPANEGIINLPPTPSDSCAFA